MVPAQLRAKIALERLSWIRQMIASIRALPLASQAEFTEDPRTPAAAESYLRRICSGATHFCHRIELIRSAI